MPISLEDLLLLINERYLSEGSPAEALDRLTTLLAELETIEESLEVDVANAPDKPVEAVSEEEDGDEDSGDDDSEDDGEDGDNDDGDVSL